MQTVLLIRHAASIGQVADAGLTAEGFVQAQVLCDQLKALKPDALFSSPFRRAIATIEPFAKATGATVAIEDDLRERCLAPQPVSDWMDHIARSFGDRNHQLTGGESMNDTCMRACSALTKIIGTNARRPAAVSHGNLIASILSAVDPEFGFDDWRSMANPDIFEIVFVDGHPTSFTHL